jgi:putative transposase
VRKPIYYRVIYRFEKIYPLGQMCRFFHVSYAGYYKWRRRQSQPDRDQCLMELIRERFEAAKQSAGYRQITLQLHKKYGLIVNHKAVYRIMRKMGIQSVARRARPYLRYCEVIHRYDNVLNRDFNCEAPNRKWVTDITYIHTGEGVLYLSAIKDLCDGSIIGHRMGTNQTLNLVKMMVQETLIKEKAADGLILHSDQGFEYTSHAYFRLTQKYSVTPSMSRRGNCLDNASMENFFGMLKTEWIQNVKFSTLREAMEAIEQYIYYYKYERCCLKTKLTPFEKRCQFA